MNWVLFEGSDKHDQLNRNIQKCATEIYSESNLRISYLLSNLSS